MHIPHVKTLPSSQGAGPSWLLTSTSWAASFHTLVVTASWQRRMTEAWSSLTRSGWVVVPVRSPWPCLAFYVWNTHSLAVHIVHSVLRLPSWLAFLAVSSRELRFVQYHTLECGWSYTGHDLVTASFQVLIQSMFTLRSYCWLLSLETIICQLQEDSHLQRRRRRSVLDSILQAKRSVSDVSPTYVITLCCYGNNMWNVSCGSWIVNVVDKTGLPGAAPNQ